MERNVSLPPIGSLKASAMASIIFLVCACNTFNLKFQDPLFNQNPGIRLTVSLAPGSRGNLDISPGRVYVTRREETQKPARLILQVSGVNPGTKIYWSYRYRSGRYNPRKNLFVSPFSACDDHPLNRWENSTTADNNGRSRVFFTATTYAGDRFQFGIGSQIYRRGRRDRMQKFLDFNATVVRSKPVDVWKRIFFERPKILKNVVFPDRTWDLIIRNLENLNIETIGDFAPVKLDPADPAISFYFTTQKGDDNLGEGRDPRYGPAGFGPIEVMLSRLTIIFTDGNPDTVNPFIFGCISPKFDLIRDDSSTDAAPKPVRYSHRYPPGTIDLKEWFATGTGSAMAGKSPAIFIWSDFWFLAGRSLGISHEKCLARVILHEMGHHLLNFKTGGKEGILDETGHPAIAILTDQSIMTGSSILRFDQKGNPFVSANARRMEKKFIEKPVWNPKIEMLIRRDYIPRETAME